MGATSGGSDGSLAQQQDKQWRRQHACREQTATNTEGGARMHTPPLGWVGGCGQPAAVAINKTNNGSGWQTATNTDGSAHNMLTPSCTSPTYWGWVGGGLTQ